jgi:hypothetical protein
MKLGIMQPYFFPWIGYFQLVNAVDRFVVYDDVGYRKGGWINRNRILVGGREHLFTLPLHGASPNRRIHEVRLRDMVWWRTRFLKTLQQEYREAPHFAETYELVAGALACESDQLSEFLVNALEVVCAELEIGTEIVPTSRRYENTELRGQERVLDICRREGADVYINAIGGMDLYRRDDFLAQGIELEFIQTKPVEYTQHGSGFVPMLSIIDVLMFNARDVVKRFLTEFSLV